jgi:NAD(P)H-flavin reductase
LIYWREYTDAWRRDYFVATAAIYVPCWTYPWLRTLFEYGLAQKAQLFVEENGFIRITISANLRWHPGQHCFLRFRSFGLHALSSHPFTICSLPSTTPGKKCELMFLVRPQSGFTAKLYKHALAHPGVRVPVLIDGPYGGIDNQKYFGSDRLVVIAGGSGAGWTLPFVEQFVRYHAQRSSVQDQPVKKHQDDSEASDEDKSPQDRLRGPRSLRVILATRDVATRTWSHKSLDMLLTSNDSPAVSDVSFEVHLTSEAEYASQGAVKATSESGEETHDSSSPAKAIAEKQTDVNDTSEAAESETRGRPDLPLLIREEAGAAASTGQTVAVFVCGPLEMQNDVRNAVAAENLRIMRNPRRGGMYLHLEHFSWA